ncbi:MAG: DMT family transporter [Alphaproteobacteria bacterium]
MTGRSGGRITGYLLLAFLSLAWGANWPAIKIAVLEMPIWQYRALTALAAGVCLLLYAALRGQPMRVPRRQWGALGAVTLTNITLWLIFVGYGVKLMESGQAALIGFTAPLWVIVLAWIFLGEPLSRRRLAALAVGMGGIVVLLWPSLGAFGARPMGALLVLGGAISFAIGTIITKRVAWVMPPGTFAGWQLVLGGLPIAVIAIVSEPMILHRASAEAWLATLYTTFAGLVLAYLAWFRIVRIFDAGTASIGTLAVPAVGLLSGAIILGEPIGWRQLTALAMVLAAVGLVLFAPQRE